MTPEQKAENIALLAPAVMGWTTVNGYIRVIKGETGFELRWDPYTNNDDAMGMLNRFHHDVALTKITGVWHCKLPGSPKYFYGHGESICEAICAACLEWARAQKGWQKGGGK